MQLAQLAIGLLLCLLPGCVVIDARQVTVYRSTTEISLYQNSTTTVEKDSPQILPPLQVPRVEKESVIVRTGCTPFVLPTRESLPVKPDFSTVPQEQMEEAIANYIKKLRTIIKSERSILDSAHREHLTGCRG